MSTWLISGKVSISQSSSANELYIFRWIRQVNWFNKSCRLLFDLTGHAITFIFRLNHVTTTSCSLTSTSLRTFGMNRLYRAYLRLAIVVNLLLKALVSDNCDTWLGWWVLFNLYQTVWGLLIIKFRRIVWVMIRCLRNHRSSLLNRLHVDRRSSFCSESRRLLSRGQCDLRKNDRVRVFMVYWAINRCFRHRTHRRLLLF